MQLSEAMECIEHICTQGCTLVGPSNVVDNNKSMEPEKSKPCKAFSTCYGLQLLIRHFAVCKRRSNDKCCLRCKRMLQLFRLHSSVCDQPDSCRVPLCRYICPNDSLYNILLGIPHISISFWVWYSWFFICLRIKKTNVMLIVKKNSLYVDNIYGGLLKSCKLLWDVS